MSQEEEMPSTRSCHAPLPTSVLIVQDVFTARSYASAVYAVVMCLSVYPSLTCRYCLKMAKHTCMITQTTPHDSPGTQTSRRNSNWVTQRGRHMQVGRLKSATFDKYSTYLLCMCGLCSSQKKRNYFWCKKTAIC